MFKIVHKIAHWPMYYFAVLIATFNLILITLAVFFYNGEYLFWEYPFSYAGHAFSMDGLPNTFSSRLYSLAMWLSGLVMLILAYKFSKTKQKLKTIFSFLGGTGFIIAGFCPDDIRHPFHVMGSALLVGTLWFLTTIYLLEIRAKVEPFRFFIWQISLQIPVFAYAGTYFLNIEPLDALLQKFAMFGLFFVLVSATSYHRKIALVHKPSPAES